MVDQNGWQQVGTWSGGYKYAYADQVTGVINRGSPYYYGYYYDTLNITTTDDSLTPVGPPAVLTPTTQPQLGAALASAAAADPQVREDLDRVIADNPGVVTAPQSITPADVKNYADQKVKEALDAYAATTAAAAAANPTDAALQNEAAKAAAEAAQNAADNLKDQVEEQEETFSPIDATAFEEPYNPGEYDIPARFTTFLNRVKSTGLFSFSADFFNSLPGGGSPIYEIEAGQYGHHTIDLSQTLTVGLAVLKTILLACFGFLSIRAVIMKR